MLSMRTGLRIRERANVLGVGIDAVDMDTAVARILAVVDGGHRGYVCVTGVHGVMEARRDEAFRRVLNRSVLTTPDGMPTVWVGRAQGHRWMRRVYGPDLMLALCEASVARGDTHFFYGGGPGVAEELAARLAARFPGLRVAGTYTPPFRPLTADEEHALRTRLDSLQPTFLWVGLSTPKQERFMAQHNGQLNVGVMLGVGAAFDMHSGHLKQAPRWMQRSGLEWFFRLTQEPRRLFMRYAINNPAFLCQIALQFTHLSRPAID